MKKLLLSSLAFFLLMPYVQSQTTFKPKAFINSSTGDAPYTIASGNIDNDANGYADIVIGTQLGNTIEIYINTSGTMSDTPVLVTNTLSSIGGLKLVDIDGTNGLDILAVGYTNDKITWYPNDGSGNFTTEHTISSTTLGASGLAFGDIDDNGSIDVAATAYDGNNVVWFANDGVDTDGFGTANTIDNTLSNPGSVNLTDIDGDGDLDAIVTTAIWPIASTDVIKIFRNDLYPANAGVSWTEVTNPVDSGLRYMFNATFEDLDGNANLDILASEVENVNNAGSFYWYEDSNADPFDGSAFTKTTWTTSIGNPAAAQLQDLDDDGLLDIVLGSGNQVANSSQIVWFRKTGAGTFAAEAVIDATQLNTFVFTINDFDKDGDLDIASCSYGSDDLTWFENEKYSLSLNDNSIGKVNIYPNPTHDNLFIEGLFQPSEAILYNVLGKQVLSGILSNDKALNISSLSKGVYFLKAKGINKTFKVVRQ